MLSEKKPVRKRQIPYDFTHVWNLMNKINKQNRLKENKLTAEGLGEKGEGIKKKNS